MNKYITYTFYLSIAFLPQRLKRYIYNAWLGHDINETARIGFSYVQAKHIKMGPYARIGKYNIIRNLEVLDMGEGSSIGNHNRADALPLSSTKHFLDQKDRLPALILGKHASITGNHFFDCNNTISIGSYTTIAGQNSLFYTHGINVEKNKQECGKILIGNYSMIAARCVIIKGAVLPDYCVLAANSTLHKAFDQPYKLYSGVPAQAVKELSPSCAYFHRENGYIS